MKFCRKCGDSLTSDNWFPSSMRSYNYECKVCAVKRNSLNRKKRGEEYLEKRRAYGKTRVRKNRCANLQRTYGITAEEWDRLFESQGSCCKICKTKDKPKSGWHTDHCHEEGFIRGILCHSCNTGIGKLKDDVMLLERAIKYINSGGSIV